MIIQIITFKELFCCIMTKHYENLPMQYTEFWVVKNLKSARWFYRVPTIYVLEKKQQQQQQKKKKKKKKKRKERKICIPLPAYTIFSI